jgi:ketosteroid isomerase-like protein
MVMTISDGITKNLSGNYLMVFQRQTDGHWLILQQVWTEAAPAAR